MHPAARASRYDPQARRHSDRGHLRGRVPDGCEQAGEHGHPSRRGNWRGTLVNALQFHYDNLSTLAGEHRPGIVHRLDRDTTGLLVVVKSELAHRRLATQFENREVHKEYLALVYGVPERHSDYIEQPIGFHPTSREKMAIRAISDGAA